MKKRIVISFGDKVFQKENKATTKVDNLILGKISELVVKLTEKYEIIIFYSKNSKFGASSHKLTQSIKTTLANFNKSKEVSTVSLRAIVDKDDPAFKKPTNPVGKFYNAKEALHLSMKKGWTLKEYPKKGFRRVVPSPTPVDIVEKREITELMPSGSIVVATYDNEKPAYRTKILKKLKDVDAVIDNDLAAEKLAELVKADILTLVTDVPNACLNYKTEDEVALHVLTTREAGKYLKFGHFELNSMKPKIEACAKFAKKKKFSAICSLDNFEKTLDRKSGTIITI